MRWTIAIARLVVAAAIITAVAAQFSLTVSSTEPFARAFVVTNFFSFFTIESNLLAAVVLVTAAVFVAGDAPAWLPTARVAVAGYMLTTGVVYNTLLRGIELPQGSTVFWSNEVLHVLAPILVVLDYLLVRAPAPRWRALWAVAAFPLVWVGYTMIRGVAVPDPRTGGPWYPYPFLDPANFGGSYGGVVAYSVVIAIIIVGGAALLLAIRRRFSGSATPARR